jgi:DNA/RNA-binding domain of Phe-tRNA-synthetase-like protein
MSDVENLIIPPVSWSLEHDELLVGLVFAGGLDVGPASAELSAWVDGSLATLPDPPEATRQAIRQLLRGGGFKPTGRNKPASEYLAAARRQGRFPRIFDVVDVNNALSLETGWPMSVLDLDRALEHSPSGALEIRLGLPGESYAFNSAGQIIDVAGLVGLAAAGGPMLGNPVKDAMRAKVQPGTRGIVAVLYTSRACATPEQVQDVATRFAERVGGGRTLVLPTPPPA